MPNAPKKPKKPSEILISPFPHSKTSTSKQRRRLRLLPLPYFDCQFSSVQFPRTEMPSVLVPRSQKEEHKNRCCSCPFDYGTVASPSPSSSTSHIHLPRNPEPRTLKPADRTTTHVLLGSGLWVPCECENKVSRA